MNVVLSSAATVRLTVAVGVVYTNKTHYYIYMDISDITLLTILEADDLKKTAVY